jgi:pSer/pThr/pTyr-binding forkhead associated (FHA) protein
VYNTSVDISRAVSRTIRQHALLAVSKGYGPLVVDLEAPNGTFVDGRRLEPYKAAKIHSQSVSPATRLVFGLLHMNRG